ncbi:bifunctional nicotinamidase/pyrazinamidase [Elioraea sp.]|uniref:bifunctional nicotinamidase/pyrazinamidase n=1 Tax=Elioraea sp. TaxID=2185103 RepID=UPI0021DEAE75|nr:bifunctional nicotinamidase/pyrazinamidase [Elioraea sp.]GIX09633.1 MAG: bifunctional pyrazinamidase/nicotinamidase [Elioraea sp.]
MPPVEPPDDETALIVVDVQVGFLPGGSLPVPEGDDVVPIINALARRYATVVLTQDWHPPDHLSFASAHPGRAPFETIALPYGPQVLWPDHCVMGTPDAAFAQGLDIPHAQAVIRKGCRRAVDSYSGFLEADRTTRTGLDGYLASRGIRTVHLCGLATDFCVAWTALDARRFGLAAAVIEEACRGIDLDGSLARAWAEMEAAGVRRIAAAGA